MNLKNKTAFITGASRGIGRAIAVRLAKEGINIVAASKSVKPHPKLKGTLKETIDLVAKNGSKGLAIQLDVRFPEKIDQAVKQATNYFNSIDILINNAGAISLTNVEQTNLKLYDRMMNINFKAAFLLSRALLPELKKSENAHIINFSPPINLNPKWLKDFSVYTASKYGMSLLTIGMAEEFKKYNIAVNSIWPKTLVATSAIEFAFGNREMLNKCRKPDIIADAVYELVKTKNQIVNGQLLIDEFFLRETGYANFDKYAVNSKYKDEIIADIFLD